MNPAPVILEQLIGDFFWQVGFDCRIGNREIFPLPLLGGIMYEHAFCLLVVGSNGLGERDE